MGVLQADRVRAALDAMPTYRRAIGHLVEADETDPRGYRCCVIGVFADVARLAGAPVELVFTACGAMLRSRARGLVFFDLEDWYGLDLADLTVRLDVLPDGLRRRCRAAIDARRRERPVMELSDLLERHDELGFPLYRLSDYELATEDVVDALRWTLDVDRHLVDDGGVR